MKIIDLHSHILPGIDDGAVNMTETLQMLRNAVASDVQAIAATPHCNVSGFCRNHYDSSMKELLQSVRQRAKEESLPLQIISGMEARAGEELPELLQAGKVLTLNASRYLLTELPTNAPPDYCENMLQRILTLSYVPLIAHPERYRCICYDPEIAGIWLDMGCHLQLTGASVLGKFGAEPKRAAEFLLRNDMVACIASDAHGVEYRTNFLGDVYSYISLHYSSRYARLLFWDTPMAICQNQQL